MQSLDDYIDQVKNLPPAPRILPELLSLLRQEDVDNSRVVQLISFDPAITANVLRLCNSALFAGATPAAELSEAVNRLGFRQIYTLVATVSGARALSPAQRGYGLNAGELWKHSVTTAVAAQLIARSQSADESVVFTAGLLHDIGKIVLAHALEHVYAGLVEQSVSQQAALLEVEQRLLGVQHAEIGGRLLTRWRLPENLVAAVCHHHRPDAAGPHQPLAAYVYLGNMIAYFMGQGYGFQAFALRGRAEALEVLGLKAESIPQYMIQTFDQLQTVETLLSAVH
jgi:putative nucleotidyltransferase with HDIG domain